jgi:hypothetical protein
MTREKGRGGGGSRETGQTLANESAPKVRNGACPSGEACFGRSLYGTEAGAPATGQERSRSAVAGRGMGGEHD